MPQPSLTITPSPSPSPSPSEILLPIPSFSPTPTTKPLSFTEMIWSKEVKGEFPIQREIFEIPTALPTGWQDVYEKRLGIPYQAWLAVSKNIAANSSKVGNVEIITGPNTVLNYPNLRGVIELVSRAVPTGRNVTNLRVLAFNFKDAPWADETFKRLYANETELFKRQHPDPVWEICPKQREACFAQAFLDSNLNGIILLGMIDRGSREQLTQTFSEYSRVYLGQLIAHEYLHTIEAIHLGSRRYIALERTPSWFSQGTAVFMEGAAPNYQSFDAYMRFRLVDSKVIYSDCPYVFCVKVNTNLIQDYMSLSHQSKNWDNFPYAMKYEMSSRIVEVLVALKGPDTMISMFRAIGEGTPFDRAFESVYGISYESAKPIIAKIVADQLENSR